MKQKLISATLMMLFVSLAFSQIPRIERPLLRSISEKDSLKFSSRKVDKSWLPFSSNQHQQNSQAKRFKSAQSNGIALDSFIMQSLDTNTGLWTDRAKYKYAYNIDQKNLEEIFQWWNDSLGRLQNINKQSFTYDSDGNETQYIVFEWNAGLGQWLNHYKSEKTYDEKGNVTQVTWSDWNSDNEKWEIANKSEYTYNEDNEMTMEVTYRQNYESDDLVEQSKYERFFDNMGNQSHTIEYTWDLTLEQWQEWSKWEYSYDSDGNEVQYLIFNWDQNRNDDWIVDFKQDYTYNEESNLTQTISYSNWGSDSVEWVGQEKSRIKYNEQNELIQELLYNYNLDLDEWVEKEKFDYAYDLNGNNSQSLWHYWNEDSEQWISLRKTELEHDENSNPLSQITYDFSENEWIETDKHILSYDLEHSLSDIATPKSFFFGVFSIDRLTNKPIELLSTYTDGNNFVDKEKTIYYYSELNASNIEGNDMVTAGLFPNPVSKMLNFNVSSDTKIALFELYDVHGRRILRKQINASNELNLDFLDSGVYPYHLSIDGKSVRGKLMKR